MWPRRLENPGSANRTGVVASAFLFPILLAHIGTARLLLILVGTSVLGAAVTWAFRIETAGVSLEDIGGPAPELPPDTSRRGPLAHSDGTRPV